MALTMEQKIWQHLLKTETDDEIVQLLHTSSRRITRVRRALRAGLPCPMPKTKGRPSKVTAQVIKITHNETANDPSISSQALALIISESTEMPVCRRTVDLVRDMLRFRYTTAPREPLLSPEHKEKRVAFCQAALANREQIDWNMDVVITDESRFCMFPDSRRIWVQRGVYNPKCALKLPKHSQGIMVWAGIGIGFKSPLVVIKGKLNAIAYQNMLVDRSVFSESIFDEMYKAAEQRNAGGYHFQQDGAPAHRAKSTVEFLKNQTKLIENWPANSPDLSPIENLWGILKAKLAKRNPKNIGELEMFLKEEYDNISQETIDGLIGGINARFRLCVHHNGDCISRFLSPKRLRDDYREPAELLQPRDIKVTNVGKKVLVWGNAVHITEVPDFPEEYLERTGRLAGTQIMMCDPDPPAGQIPKKIVMIDPTRGHWEIRGYFLEVEVKGRRRSAMEMTQSGRRRCLRPVIDPYLEFIEIIDETIARGEQEADGRETNSHVEENLLEIEISESSDESENS
jgi:transposase